MEAAVNYFNTLFHEVLEAAERKTLKILVKKVSGPNIEPEILKMLDSGLI
jgi:hypothetical protein